MNKAELTLTYKSSVLEGEEENYWLHIMDSGDLEEMLTREEAAEFIDSLYDLEACNAEDTEGGDEPEQDEEGEDVPPVSEEDFISMAQDFLSETELCDDDGTYDTDIIVAKSHQQYAYKLIFDNGEIKKRETVSEGLTIYYTLNNQKSLTLEFPVLSGLTIQWNGNVYGENGQVVIAPSYELNGSTLYFPESYTGSITCTYATQYDLITVHVYNDSPDFSYAGIERPQRQNCNVVGFYQGTVTEYTITPPDKDESATDGDSVTLCGGESSESGDDPDVVNCYDLVHQITRCRCSETEVSRRDIKVGRECSKRMKHCPGSSACEQQIGEYSITTNYTKCSEEEGLEDTVSDPDYYLSKCCVNAPFTLPPCKVIKRVFPGGAKYNGNKDNYPGYNFVAIGPINHDVCGEITTTWQVPSLDCCDYAAPFYWSVDEEDSYLNGDTISPGGRTLLLASGGEPPYLWKAIGNIYFKVNETFVKQVWTEGNDIYVYGGEGEICGVVTVTVEDSCEQQLSWNLRGPTGSWVLFRTREWNYYDPWSTDYSCYITDDGIMTGDYSAEIIRNERKTLEYYEQSFTMEGISGGATADPDCAPCSDAVADANTVEGRPVWPPCNTAHTVPCQSTSVNGCYDPCPSGCKTCDCNAIWMRWNDNCGGYNAWQCFGRHVNRRDDYEWRCV